MQSSTEILGKLPQKDLPCQWQMQQKDVKGIYLETSYDLIVNYIEYLYSSILNITKFIQRLFFGDLLCSHQLEKLRTG